MARYVAKLLHSSAAELRPLLIHIWASILRHDRSCQVECLKGNGHVYFLNILVNGARPPPPSGNGGSNDGGAAAGGDGGSGGGDRGGGNPESAAGEGTSGEEGASRKEESSREQPSAAELEAEMRQERASAHFVLGALCDGHESAQQLCLEMGAM